MDWTIEIYFLSVLILCPTISPSVQYKYNIQRRCCILFCLQWGIRLRRDRSPLSYLGTGRTGEWRQLKFCPFGRVLFIVGINFSNSSSALDRPRQYDASYMYSSSDLFIAYRPPTTPHGRRDDWQCKGLCSPPLMHYFGFASPRRAVATAADIELLRWLATDISKFNNEFMGRPGRFLLH